MISQEIEAKILRLFHAERWRPNTIAHQLGIHHSTVLRVLSQAGQIPPTRVTCSILDPYLPFMRHTLDTYPRLTASRLFHMIAARGFQGSESHVRAVVQRIRPRPKAEAYFRLQTLPGEQAQVDWAHFGKIKVGNAERRLYGFVMVLGWSRAVFLRFHLGHDHTAFFLRSHQDAFQFFGGVPRVILYDNLKSAVLERAGSAIRFNPKLLEFAGHYRFEPRPVAVARGNEKGKVERSIRYIRDSFFAARQYKDLDDLNAQALSWCLTTASERRCPGEPTLTVRAAWQEEGKRLLAVPDNPFNTDERIEVRVGKTPYAHFDLNDYSVPHDRVQKSLTVLASPETVRILDGVTEVASHPRTYDRNKTVEDPAHHKALAQAKRQAKDGRGLNRLLATAPVLKDVLKSMTQDSASLGNTTRRLLRLLDTYGPNEVEAAASEALALGKAHPGAIEQIILQKRRKRGLRPPVDAAVSELAAGLVKPVKTASLTSYDRLGAGKTADGGQS